MELARGRAGPTLLALQMNHTGPNDSQQIQQLNRNVIPYLTSLSSRNGLVPKPLIVQNQGKQVQIPEQEEQEQQEQEHLVQEDRVQVDQVQVDQGEDDDQHQDRLIEVSKDRIKIPPRGKDTNRSGNRHQRVMKYLNDQIETLRHPINEGF